MANASNYLRTDIGAKYLNGLAGSGTLTLFLAAFVGNMAADETGGTEHTIGVDGYARVAIGTSQFAESPAGTFTNISAFSFPVASGSWGSIASIGVYDAASGGNMILFDDLTGGAVTVGTGITLTIPIGDLDVTVA